MTSTDSSSKVKVEIENPEFINTIKNADAQLLGHIQTITYNIAQHKCKELFPEGILVCVNKYNNIVNQLNCDISLKRDSCCQIFENQWDTFKQIEYIYMRCPMEIWAINGSKYSINIDNSH